MDTLLQLLILLPRHLAVHHVLLVLIAITQQLPLLELETSTQLLAQLVSTALQELVSPLLAELANTHLRALQLQTLVWPSLPQPLPSPDVKFTQLPLLLLAPKISQDTEQLPSDQPLLLLLLVPLTAMYAPSIQLPISAQE
jgi:hypothetical protein